jgi:hypothetical protein
MDRITPLRLQQNPGHSALLVAWPADRQAVKKSKTRRTKSETRFNLQNTIMPLTPQKFSLPLETMSQITESVIPDELRFAE